MRRIYVLMGGVISWDGAVTSAGMNGLIERLRPLGLVMSWPWHEYRDMVAEIAKHPDDKTIGIGYSGGGAHLTWAATGYYETVNKNGQRERSSDPYKPRFDLMVLYDPSPKSGMFDLTNFPNVKRCLLYYNESPLMFGLGGGITRGPQVMTIAIREQHLAVQFDKKLHDRTVMEVSKT